MNQNAKPAQKVVPKSKPKGVKKYQGIQAKAVWEMGGKDQRPTSSSQVLVGYL